MTTVQFPLSLSCAVEATNRRLRYMHREVYAAVFGYDLAECCEGGGGGGGGGGKRRQTCHVLAGRC